MIEKKCETYLYNVSLDDHTWFCLKVLVKKTAININIIRFI